MSGRGWLSARAGLLLALSLLSGCTSLTGFYFYPQQAWVRTPEALGLEYQDIYLTATDGTRVHGWWMNGVASESGSESDRNASQVVNPNSKPMVLFLHGNGENISTHVRSIAWLVYAGVDVFALDYRGYGVSAGSPALPMVLQDVEAAASWLRGKYPQRPLFVLGQSLGGGLAIIFGQQAAERYRIDGVITESAPYSYTQAAREILASNPLGWLVWPAAWLLPEKWDPAEFTSAFPVPVLLMHSPDDKVVRYHHGRSLLQALKPSACWQQTLGPHIGGFASGEVRQRVLQFINNKGC